MALGGVRDEAEIEYIAVPVGSMPGKIIQGMKRQVKRTHSFCWMKLINWVQTGVVTQAPPYLRYWIQPKIVVPGSYGSGLTYL